MNEMLHSNIMLFPSGNKMMLVTIVDADYITAQLPEEHRKDNIAFAMAITRVGIDGRISISIDPQTTIEGEAWGEKCNDPDLAGRSISGIITSPVWFCKKITDFFNGLM